MDENLHKQMVFDTNSKSIAVAYLLWLFLGGFGVHRFYAGRTKTGIAQLVLLVSVIGWLVLIPWLLADLVLIPGLINDHNSKVIDMLNGPAKQGRAAEPARKLETEADRRREAMLEDLRQTGYPRERRDSSHLFR